ncbi:bifunctional cytochrome P450/NADPH--P450 reductase [Streptomyces sp. RTd22]|uniref:bifunctional cytochrome P450/NADPH--P450 reductase n=1 Tax=Streptomyces sp. RTd22 TaxID=1841249 RepID=UPI0007C5A459|nr:cytochrome P450 [Streptomyces sp. RTd22]
MTRATTQALEPIPEPPPLSAAGDAPSGFDMVAYLIRQARELGPIYRLREVGTERIIVSGLDVMTELADESRFRKKIEEALGAVRLFTKDGLFTAHNDEPNWRKAHDVLMPAFSLGAMRDYHGTMLRVARELLAKWDRAEEGQAPVDAPGDMTRLTFDTIGLCGFGYDFESFRREELHPFVTAMSRSLLYAQALAEGPGGADLPTDQFERDRALMADLVDEVIRERKESGDMSTDDLLGRMLHTTDQVTGTPLDDENIRHQVITFLIAGHETTSGALSFALYYLLKHPAVLARAQAEVDALWGDTDEPDPTYNDIGKLGYLRQVLNEALRLWPTAGAFAVTPLEDTVVAGKYAVRKGETMTIVSSALHRDPVWGDNVELFDPDRFSPERVEARSVHAFKPFGNGERACIGRQFALHEATLMLGLLIHRYRLIDHTNYQLAIHRTLTIKPGDFHLRLVRRTPSERRPLATTSSRATASSAQATSAALSATGTALTVLYGSNLGTGAGIARDLAADGDDRGFTPAVQSLDQAVGKLNTDGPVVIVAASYNGRPTDDAAKFMAWLEGLQPGSLDGLTYAVLGVGDRNWAATYQRIPTLIDERLAAAGATRLLKRGAADAAGDFDGTVRQWTGDLWGALLEKYGTTAGGAPADAPDTDLGLYEIQDAAESVTGALAARHGVQPMEVLEARELVDTDHPLGRSKYFLRLRLPEGVGYRTGDHLAVLPRNPESLVQRIAGRFGLDLDRTVRLTTRRRSRHALPIDRPLTLRRLLTDFVELQGAATQEQVGMLVAHTECPPERRPLAELASVQPDAFREQITDRGITVLDLLEQYPACELSFDRFLEMLPVLRPRHYSISSSAAANPGEVDLMISLLQAPHRSGSGTFGGIASHHLQTIRPGDTVQARVLPCRETFRLPEDTDIPVILVSAGTGLAPFRGAVLDRLHAGSTGTLLCYFGCDHPDVDYLHRDELERAEAAGVVSLRPTFMHAPQNGLRFVQERIDCEGDEVWSLLQGGARVFVCGDGRRMAPGVREAFRAVYRRHTGADDEAAAAWLAEMTESGRYVEDVWAG